MADALPDLLAYLGAAPSPFHAVHEAALRLDAAGFSPLEATEPWTEVASSGYVVRGGSLVAWHVPPTAGPAAPFRLVGAHTDSPNLRVTPQPDAMAAGLRHLGVEVYGGALRNSWLNRDLGMSGRVTVRTAAGTEQRLICVDRPVCTVPQLAIHLDRSVNETGLLLNPHTQLRPVWGLTDGTTRSFRQLVAAAAEVDAPDLLGWQAMLHDLTPPATLGDAEELLASARLDNLVSCWAGVRALAATGDDRAGDAEGAARSAVAVLVLFDHEEVGSVSATGAGGAWLEHVLERLVAARGGSRADLLTGLAGSCCASADGAHATHPNYLDRHDAQHPVLVDGGPAVKFNANQRYATDDATAVALVDACERAGVPVQRYVNRADLPCGSTIGPITAARLAVPTADIGVPQLAMHSARELCGRHDPERLAAALAAFLTA